MARHSERQGYEGRKRHGCLTVYLILGGLLTALAVLSNLTATDSIAAFYTSDFASPGIVIQGLLGIGLLISFGAMWYWKRWGLFLYIGLAATGFVINLLVGVSVGASLIGVAGAAIMIFLVRRQWGNFEGR